MYSLRKQLTSLIPFTILLLIASLSGCGGGSSSDPSAASTPVTSTSNDASTKLSASLKLTKSNCDTSIALPAKLDVKLEASRVSDKYSLKVADLNDKTVAEPVLPANFTDGTVNGSDINFFTPTAGCNLCSHQSALASNVKTPICTNGNQSNCTPLLSGSKLTFTYNRGASTGAMCTAEWSGDVI